MSERLIQLPEKQFLINVASRGKYLLDQVNGDDRLIPYWMTLSSTNYQFENIPMVEAEEKDPTEMSWEEFEASLSGKKAPKVEQPTRNILRGSFTGAPDINLSLLTKRSLYVLNTQDVGVPGLDSDMFKSLATDYLNTCFRTVNPDRDTQRLTQVMLDMDLGQTITAKQAADRIQSSLMYQIGIRLGLRKPLNGNDTYGELNKAKCFQTIKGKNGKPDEYLKFLRMFKDYIRVARIPQDNLIEREKCIDCDLLKKGCVGAMQRFQSDSLIESEDQQALAKVIKLIEAKRKV